MPEKKEVSLLLVEDDPGHALLVEKNLRRANITNDIIKVDDGGKALDYLFCKGEYEDRQSDSPLLVLLDLNLPVIDGYEVLKQMKGDDRTRHIPVIILTTTDDEREVKRCYELGCNIYITKPVDYGHFSEAITKLGLFFSVVTVPHEKRNDGRG